MSNISVGRWPGYLDDAPRVRQLGIVDMYGRLSMLVGDVFWFRSWATMKELLFRLDPLPEMYCTNLTEQWWFAAAREDPEVELNISPALEYHFETPVNSLFVRRKNQRVWIIDAKAWDHKTASPDFLDALSSLFDLCGVGVRPTPGALGQALMRSCWAATGLGFISRPPNVCRQVMLDHQIGGRVDSFTCPRDRFEQVFESDISGAYASVVDYLPAGPTVTLLREPGLSMKTWYMECQVHIPEDSREEFGVFCVNQGGVNRYPIEEGYYRVWLWKEEVDACRRSGWVVVPSRGWGWTRWSRGLQTWATYMFNLRRMVREINPVLAAWIKQATVAGLGRFGMPLYRWVLVRESEARRGDIELPDADFGRETHLWLRKVDELETNHLTHWYSYIMMRTRLVLRSRMRWEYDRGNKVLDTNYDSLRCLLPSEGGSPAYSLGDWKSETLTGVRFPYARAVTSDEKTRLPGIPFDNEEARKKAGER